MARLRQATRSLLWSLSSLSPLLQLLAMTVRAITRPLYRVNESLTVASSGDLTHRLDDSAQDEFGLLARNCNTLIGNLKELITAINVRAEQLAAASEQNVCSDGANDAFNLRIRNHKLAK